MMRSGRSGATASRAVFFSGLTVVVALAGMLLVPTTIFRSLAGGAIIVVLVSVASSMTLLPAVLVAARRSHQLAVPVPHPHAAGVHRDAVGGALVGGVLAAAGAVRGRADRSGSVGFVAVGVISAA